MENDSKEQQLVKVEVHDVEEGEISDSASVEEITEEAFNIKHATAPSPPPVPPPPPKSSVNPNNVSVGINNNNNNNTRGGTGPRFWSMRDLCKYQFASKTAYSGLYSLAWKQAVNNKPLGDVFVMMEGGSNDSSSGNNDSNSARTSNDNESKIVIDVEDDGEKEEGELEEGEIDLDLDSELVIENKDFNVTTMKEVGGDVNEKDELERRVHVDSIKEELRSLDVADAQE